MTFLGASCATRLSSKQFNFKKEIKIKETNLIIGKLKEDSVYSSGAFVNSREALNGTHLTRCFLHWFL